MKKPEQMSVEELENALLSEQVDINDINLSFATQREAFLHVLHKRPSILKKVHHENGKHFLNFAIETNYENFIYLDRKQYTEHLASAYIYHRLTETDTDTYSKKSAQDIHIQRSLDEKTRISYFYFTQDGDEIHFFDKELNTLLPLKSGFKLSLKIDSAIKLIEKLDIDVAQLGTRKIISVITDMVENQYRSFMYSYIKDNPVGYYSLCTAVEDIEQKLTAAFNTTFKGYGMSVSHLSIKKMAVAEDILQKIEDLNLKNRQRHADMVAEAELARLSLESYEAKLAIQEKYPNAEHSLTEYEKDRALDRYLIKLGRKTEETTDRTVKSVNTKEQTDKTIERRTEDIPNIKAKESAFPAAFALLVVAALFAIIIGLTKSVGTGLIVLGVAILLIGILLAFNYQKFSAPKTEPLTEDTGAQTYTETKAQEDSATHE